MSEARGYSYGDFLLDPHKMRFSRSERGSLILTLDGEEYTDLKIRRAFPLEESDRYIGVFAAEDQELGLIEDPQQLDDQSRQVLLDELDKIYFQPQVLAFTSLDEEFGVLRGQIETTSGPRQLEIPRLSHQCAYAIWWPSHHRGCRWQPLSDRQLAGAAAKDARDSGAVN